MAITLEETEVNNSLHFRTMLTDLQANILKHHGRDHAYHLFLSVKEGKAKETQKWISDFAVSYITTAFKQLVDTDNFKHFEIDGGTVHTLSLSASGYKKLGIDAALWPEDTPFLDGMKKFPEHLADDPDDWEEAFRQDADLLVIVADSNEAVAEKRVDELLKTIVAIFDLQKIQKGRILKNGKVGIEHFGYADGVSQPLFMEEELVGRKPEHWNDKAMLKLALVKDKGGKTKDSFGSYLVFRKLEQNVSKFKEKEKKIEITNRKGRENEELSGGMLVGRFEDGTPTLLFDAEQKFRKTDDIPNDFNYPPQAGESKCPFHAHIRITNPRADVGNDFAHGVRLVRRGIPYDEIGRNDNLDIHPEGGVGLLFMCYQASIAKQFQFIQQKWVNEGEIGPDRFVGQDGVIGQGHNTFEKRLPQQWGQDMPDQKCDFSNPKSQFVTMRGGEYFFTPSVSFLISLFTGNDAGEAQQALL